MVDLLVAVAMALFIFRVPFRGNIVELFALSGIFLLGALMMGILISIGAKNQLLASQIAIMTTFMPAFLLSGFMYAISNMPQVIQVITYIIPARYFITILKGIYLKGVGFSVLWKPALFLLIFGLLMVSIANKKFKKKVA
jgi:ABC-2 type transport system permease protein